MIIILEPAIEAWLLERAVREGQDTNTLANALLANCLVVEDAEKEKAFDRALLESGLVKRIAPPRAPAKADRPLIVVRGKPVSETILEERR